MDIKKFERDFLAANVKTATTVLNATGWKEGLINSAGMNVDSVFLYAFDQSTEWVWGCSVPRDNFFEIVDNVIDFDAKKAKDIPVFAGQMITLGADIDSGKCGKLFGVDEQNKLGIALAAYTSMTQSYGLTQGATKANHFFVINYRASQNVRPFASAGPARHMLTVEEVVSNFRNVCQRDRKNHPEWFSKNK